MMLAIGWLALAFVAAAIASSKNRSAIGYLLFGLLLPPIAVLLAIGIARRPSAAEVAAHEPEWKRRNCPTCGEKIAIGATKCRFCGADVVPIGAISNWLWPRK